jgi:tol-pal system protein YbgF
VAAGAGQGAAPGGAEGPAGEGTLGVVPQSALLGLPRPEPGTVATPPRTTNLPPQQQYDAAMQLLRAGDYAGAEGGLQLFLDLNPEHALAPNAAYWLAETHYVRKSYAAAAAAFARNYRVYGKDDTKAPDNLLKLGMSLEGLQETDKACRTFAELAKEFPNAPAHIQQALVRERERAECA